MLILLLATRKVTDSFEVMINCPVCTAQGTLAKVYDMTEGGRLVSLSTTTWVRCGTCKGKFLLPMRAAAAGDLTIEELSALLRPYVSPVYKMLAIAGLLLFCAPVMGVTISAISLIGTYEHGGNWRRASLVGLIGGGIISAIVVIHAVLH
jgi:hypothetical protein